MSSATTVIRLTLASSPRIAPTQRNGATRRSEGGAKMLKKCVFCHEGEVEDTRIALDLGRGDVSIHIDGIPAQHCPVCGSDGINGPLAEQISEGAERITGAIEAMTATPV